MTKTKIALVAVGVMLLAGCGNKAVENNSSQEQTEASKMETPVQKGGVINSIKDAMGLGETMKCVYTDTIDGGRHVSEAYVKGNKYKSTNEENGKKMVSLFDGTTMYSWIEGEVKGTKMAINCLEDLPKPESDKVNASDDNNVPEPKEKPEDEFDNAMDVKCEPASGVEFNPPTDITFADQCEMMKNMMKNIPNGASLPKNMPQGVPGNIPTGEPQL